MESRFPRVGARTRIGRLGLVGAVVLGSTFGLAGGCSEDEPVDPATATSTTVGTTSGTSSSSTGNTGGSGGHAQTQGFGEPCTWDDVNAASGPCSAEFECLGALLSASCTDPSDCEGRPNADCVGGQCGFSLCASMGCAVAQECSALEQGSCCLPVDAEPGWACLSEAMCASGDRGFMEPCNWGDLVNPDAGDCGTDLFCYGSRYDGDMSPAVPCTVDQDCPALTDGNWGCFDGFCGNSRCTRPCDTADECTAFAEGACCVGSPGRCRPVDECTPGTGEVGVPCNHPVYGMTGAVDCAPSLHCVGYYASPVSPNPIACADDTTCEAAIGAAAHCTNDSCARTWCSHVCEQDVDCEVEFGAGACCVENTYGLMCYPPEVCSALSP